MLPADLLTLLREWWKVGHQQGVMHRDGWAVSRTARHEADQHPATSIRIVVDAAQAAEITKRVGPHTLRCIIPSAGLFRAAGPRAQQCGRFCGLLLGIIKGSEEGHELVIGAASQYGRLPDWSWRVLVP